MDVADLHAAPPEVGCAGCPQLIMTEGLQGNTAGAPGGARISTRERIEVRRQEAAVLTPAGGVVLLCRGALAHHFQQLFGHMVLLQHSILGVVSHILRRKGKRVGGKKGKRVGSRGRRGAWWCQ